MIDATTTRVYNVYMRNAKRERDTKNAIVIASHNVNDATNATTTQNEHVSRYVINDVNDVTKIHDLLNDLSIAKKIANASSRRDECKKIRRALRALNHFGGVRERSSRYYDARKHDLRTNRLNERIERMLSHENAFENDDDE